MSPDQVYIGLRRVQLEISSHVLAGPASIAFGLQNPAEYVTLPEALVLRIELQGLRASGPPWRSAGRHRDPSARLTRRPVQIRLRIGPRGIGFDQGVGGLVIG
jgi:hypothetical protein